MLIRNGVLTEYLNHRETAGRFDLEPNAGARAQDGLHHPLVRMSNTVIQGGSHRDLDALLTTLSTACLPAAPVVGKLTRAVAPSSSRHKKPGDRGR